MYNEKLSVLAKNTTKCWLDSKPGPLHLESDSNSGPSQYGFNSDDRAFKLLIQTTKHVKRCFINMLHNNECNKELFKN